MKKLLLLSLLMTPIIAMQQQHDAEPTSSQLILLEQLEKQEEQEGNRFDHLKPSVPVATNNGSEPTRKRKVDNEKAVEDRQITPLYPQIYFDNEIHNVMRKIILEEKGKIWGAYYLVTSDKLTDCWIARKYLQQLKKAEKDNDIKGLITAAKELTSPKEDILIVDKEILKKDTTALKKLVAHGITVLFRSKQREPANPMQAMHLKFMIIFDEIGNPKLLIKGSYNLTNQADLNWEDIEIIDNPQIIQRFAEQHVKLRDYCEEFTQLTATA